MLQRLWVVLSAIWAGVFLLNGLSKVDGLQRGDLLVALGPPVIVVLMGESLRWVVRGPRPPE